MIHDVAKLLCIQEEATPYDELPAEMFQIPNPLHHVERQRLLHDHAALGRLLHRTTPPSSSCFGDSWCLTSAT